MNRQRDTRLKEQARKAKSQAKRLRKEERRNSAVCPVRFEQTGMEISPKRFCSNGCKMDAWAIRRVKALLEGLSDEKALEILRS